VERRGLIPPHGIRVMLAGELGLELGPLLGPDRLALGVLGRFGLGLELLLVEVAVHPVEAEVLEATVGQQGRGVEDFAELLEVAEAELIELVEEGERAALLEGEGLVEVLAGDEL